MLIKESLLIIFIIVLFQYINNPCQAIRCYSCSDCNNSTQLTTWNHIQTINQEDQCIRATIRTNTDQDGRTIINRGASPNCKPYTGTHSSIFCCNTDLCND